MKKENKVDMSGFNEKHAQILWQTLYDILAKKGELGNYQIIVKNTRKKIKVGEKTWKKQNL